MDKLIFIVDDEQAISKLLSHWAKDKWKYNVETFSNAEDALRNLNKKPDAILLDIMLPGMDGIETLKRIKQFDENLPVIMLSAQGSIEVAVEALRYGAFDYFTKPIDQQKLELAIKNSVKNFDLTRELQNLKENVKKEDVYKRQIAHLVW